MGWRTDAKLIPSNDSPTYGTQAESNAVKWFAYYASFGCTGSMYGATRHPEHLALFP